MNDKEKLEQAKKALETQEWAKRAEVGVAVEKMRPLGIDGNWIAVHDGDPRVVALYRRHYSSEGRLGPGYTLRPYYVWWWKFCCN